MVGYVTTTITNEEIEQYMISKFGADNNLKPFFSIREASDYLGVEYKTLYRIVLAGKLPASRIGGIYRIKKEDIAKYVEDQKLTVGGDNVPICGRCHRMIKSTEMIGGQCEHSFCEALLCRACWANKRDRYCLEHKRSPKVKLAEAHQQLKTGEIPVLVTAAEARQKELDFIGRFDQKIQRFREITSPVDGTRFRIDSWKDIHEENSDMEFTGTPNMSKEDITSPSVVFPRNLRSTYSILRARKTKHGGGGFVIEATIFSHIRACKEDGFDVVPASHAELVWLLERSIYSAKHYSALFVVGFASPTGWASEACDAISGEQTGRGFSSLYISPCLIDLRKDTVIANPLDKRLRLFIDVFRGDLDEEVIKRVMDFVESEFVSRESQTLREVAEATDADASLVREAFARLAQKGDYILSHLDKLGLTILRQK